MLLLANVLARTAATECPVLLEKEQLNWRLFAAQDAINAQWDEPATPTYYVIDTTGVIRYKWVGHPGEKAIDTALETLIKEAEGKT